MIATCRLYNVSVFTEVIVKMSTLIVYSDIYCVTALKLVDGSYVKTSTRKATQLASKESGGMSVSVASAVYDRVFFYVLIAEQDRTIGIITVISEGCANLYVTICAAAARLISIAVAEKLLYSLCCAFFAASANDHAILGNYLVSVIVVRK